MESGNDFLLDDVDEQYLSVIPELIYRPTPNMYIEELWNRDSIRCLHEALRPHMLSGMLDIEDIYGIQHDLFSDPSGRLILNLGIAESTEPFFTHAVVLTAAQDFQQYVKMAMLANLKAKDLNSTDQFDHSFDVGPFIAHWFRSSNEVLIHPFGRNAQPMTRVNTCYRVVLEPKAGLLTRWAGRKADINT